MRLAEAVRPRPQRQPSPRRPNRPRLHRTRTLAETSGTTSARIFSPALNSNALVTRREHELGRTLPHGSRHHRRSTMRIRTLALASVVAVPGLALQSAFAQTTKDPGQPQTSGSATAATSPSATQPTPYPTTPGVSTGSTAATTPPAGATHQLAVKALEDMDLVGPDGKKIADVE